MTVWSSTIGDSYTPFSIESRGYGYEQDSTLKYYYWSQFALSYRTNSQGVSLFDYHLTLNLEETGRHQTTLGRLALTAHQRDLHDHVRDQRGLLLGTRILAQIHRVEGGSR